MISLLGSSGNGQMWGGAIIGAAFTVLIWFATNHIFTARIRFNKKLIRADKNRYSFAMYRMSFCRAINVRYKCEIRFSDNGNAIYPLYTDREERPAIEKKGKAVIVYFEMSETIKRRIAQRIIGVDFNMVDDGIYYLLRNRNAKIVISVNAKHQYSLSEKQYCHVYDSEFIKERASKDSVRFDHSEIATRRESAATAKKKILLNKEITSR